MFQRVELADIEYLKVILDETDDVGTMADGQVEVDDGETVRETVHEREQTGRETVNAAEREGVELAFCY